jgi:hypothetical protein
MVVEVARPWKLAAAAQGWKSVVAAVLSPVLGSTVVAVRLSLAFESPVAAAVLWSRSPGPELRKLVLWLGTAVAVFPGSACWPTV